MDRIIFVIYCLGIFKTNLNHVQVQLTDWKASGIEPFELRNWVSFQGFVLQNVQYKNHTIPYEKTLYQAFGC